MGGAGVALIIGATIQQRIRVQKAWEAMASRADDLAGQLEKARAPRPVLWGAAGAADSDPHYRVAAERSAAVDHIAGEALGAWRSRRAEDPAAAETLRRNVERTMGEALAELRLATRATTGFSDPDFAMGFAVPRTNILPWRALSNACVLRAVGCLERRDDVEAVRWLLDGARLGSDLMDRPSMIEEVIGAAVLTIPIRSLLADGLLMQLTPRALRELESGLALLDDSMETTSLSAQGDLLAFANGALASDSLAAALHDSEMTAASWRYAFSLRLMTADHVQTMVETLEAARRWSGLPWPQHWARLQGARRELSASSNPITALAGNAIGDSVRSRLQALAWVRLARIAVHYRLDGTALNVADPFGSDWCRTESSEIELTAWSNGPEGEGRDGQLVWNIKAAMPAKPK